MTQESDFRQAIKHLAEAIGTLENAVDARLEHEQDFVGAQEEVQRLNTDRSRLASLLDESEGRAERLADANREVSNRLVAAMETIRAVVDR
ncbi:DUF4164 domain-containing protein [Notoacmeibacter sp. MSK16QG-6]|uniref:DUF4164 domain-containing protein n=1 Tax=Notoacmeibacter sp. MSK16QG-6 TaxID=2957982 RepID=UPI00209F0A80|nr:DUF4164 domain-containing protein [Notoacmeibacter sp. MSK16QG-6]MCP1200179.1 DUF4164 domain-containing protein [Notoacmeibacter sp. MSK16QG-6]